MKKTILFVLFTVVIGFVSCQRTVTIVQIADPQFGFYDRDDLSYEISTMNRAVEIINRMQPDVVVFTGDLVHHPDEEKQWQEFVNLASMIDKGIIVRYVPGNHDGVIADNHVSMERFNTHIGADRFCDRVGNVLLTGINSNLVFFGDESDSLRMEQFEWLRQSLRMRKKGGVSIVFGHHPFFVEDIDEEDGYFQIPGRRRREYFELFAQEGVKAYFNGHLHSNAEASFDGIMAVTTSALGRPLGDAPSGMRVITVKDGAVSHEYLPVDAAPCTAH